MLPLTLLQRLLFVLYYSRSGACYCAIVLVPPYLCELFSTAWWLLFSTNQVQVRDQYNAYILELKSNCSAKDLIIQSVMLERDKKDQLLQITISDRDAKERLLRSASSESDAQAQQIRRDASSLDMKSSTIKRLKKQLITETASKKEFEDEKKLELNLITTAYENTAKMLDRLLTTGISRPHGTSEDNLCGEPTPIPHFGFY